MLSPLEVAGVSLFVVAVIGAFAWNFTYPRFLKRVHTTDATTWARLGTPRIRWFGYEPTLQLMSYLHAREYMELRDSLTVGLATHARMALFAVYAGIGGAVVLLGLAACLGT